ncbi:MAG: ribosome silencing factor [Candidatus Pacebacteria bacterium]|nr:ribosome silencing factor [Candidatus Paceibacterota bacterium]
MTETKAETLEFSPDVLAKRCLTICEDRKAQDILLYDLTDILLITDFCLICSASSEPHIRAISNRLRKELSDEGLRPEHVDGDPASRWVVLDYGTIVVHIFHPEVRDFYRLEELWESGRLIYEGPEE